LNDSAEQHRYVIGVLRDPESRGGSVAVHDDINQGDTIQISSPKNHFELVHAKRSLLFAGGIGVTPILCMARRLSHIDADFEMHYNSRTPERMAFREAISNSSFADKVHFHFDNGDDSQKLDLAPLLANPQPDTHLYVCGPTGYIDFVVNTAKQAGWPSDHVHLEYFGAAESESSGVTSFEAMNASSGHVVSNPVVMPIT